MAIDESGAVRPIQQWFVGWYLWITAVSSSAVVAAAAAAFPARLGYVLAERRAR